ncbi:unnamed protein product [Anisakis simplex]|uniref:DUF2268 domain-containing protein n=1 Tax=Anisakis simplex TaxID=6269 RepID=A0A0M3JYH3_ANISI|nr:unnamed protein product [Anisakis simplex]
MTRRVEVPSATRVYADKLDEVIKNIGLMDNGINCDELASGNVPESIRQKAERWTYDFEMRNPLLDVANRNERCNYLTKQYGFNTVPLSDEENEFPIAYGLLVFRTAIQYLSGFDLPLKTNREMVRIFKQLNGSFNTEVLHYDYGRLWARKGTKAPHGIHLFKSSLSATFSRESANYIANNTVVNELIHYLNGTHVPDETFWTTVAGNPEKIPMPGAFNGTRFLQFTDELERRQQNEIRAEFATSTMHYYISRYQVWWFSRIKICNGEFVKDSCVYGIGDIPILLGRRELVAHKFYLHIQPAAYFCVYQKVRQRAISHDIDSFDDRPYANLPGPALKRGVNLDVWTKRYF